MVKKYLKLYETYEKNRLIAEAGNKRPTGIPQFELIYTLPK